MFYAAQPSIIVVSVYFLFNTFTTKIKEIKYYIFSLLSTYETQSAFIIFHTPSDCFRPVPNSDRTQCVTLLWSVMEAGV